MSNKSKEMNNLTDSISELKPRLLIVSGPSGVGKGTLLKRVISESKLPLTVSVSATTRKPRPDEKNGIHYHFFSNEQFQTKKNAGEFLECFEVFSKGVWYGTLKADVEKGLAEGNFVVLEIDVKGANEIKKQFPNAITIFVKPPNTKTLKERLQGRGTESEEAMQNRLKTAIEELNHADEFQYCIVNDDLDNAVKQFIKIIKNNLN
ncbi:MAG: guanylate kinase [Planctomycetaceae bacterium]|jgi:guanylate kinase|nr:guanylate kinase [Planctomycetaceae bacterium]